MGSAADAVLLDCVVGRANGVVSRIDSPPTKDADTGNGSTLIPLTAAENAETLGRSPARLRKGKPPRPKSADPGRRLLPQLSECRVPAHARSSKPAISMRVLLVVL